MGDSDGCSPTDEYYEALANRFRREILCVVHDRETLSVEELATDIAGLYDRPERDIRTALDHVHLPKLAAVDFIEYDRRSGAIRATDSEFLEKRFSADILDCKSCATGDISIET